jgi:hypothetical protein
MSAPEQPLSFDYTAQWRIICKKDQLNATVRQYNSTLTHMLVMEAKNWIESEVA